MSMTTPSHHISVQQEAHLNRPPESQTTDTLPDIPQKQSVTKGIGMKTIDRTAERSGGSIPKKVRTGSRTLRRISSVDTDCGSSLFFFFFISLASGLATCCLFGSSRGLFCL